jgi:LIVCS family branched-chain amino acid:cation transporter
MNRLKIFFLSETLTLGLAMFCMFFGAGNVIFPLYLGQICQNHYLAGFLGLFLTAVFMPFVGVFVMILFEGNIRGFFGRFGKSFGVFLSSVLMILLGPLGSTPRCLALTFSSFKSIIPQLNGTIFFLFLGLVLYFSAKNKQIMMKILGQYVTPILIGLLIFIIGFSIFSPIESMNGKLSQDSAFLQGLHEGYNTMDLLAAFFFSSSIITSLKKYSQISPRKDLVKKALISSLIGASLLSFVYLGFAHLSAKFSYLLIGVPKDQILLCIMLKLFGEKAAIIVAIVISLACITTAIALLSVFVEFLDNEISFLKKIGQSNLLLISTLITLLMAGLEFGGISKVLTPILNLIYPFLILFTFFQLFEKIYLKGLQFYRGLSKL